MNSQAEIENSGTSSINATTKRALLKRLVIFSMIALASSLLVFLIAPARVASDLLLTHLTILTLTFLLSIAYIFLKAHQQQALKNWLKQAWLDLSKQQKRYLAVVFLGTFLLIGNFVGTATSMQEILILTFIFICCVALWDILAWYRQLSEKILGKAAIAVGFAIASTYAYALAAQKISLIIQVTPTNFTRATVLVAIMQIPILIAIAGAIISALCIAASSLLMLPFMIPGANKITDLFIEKTDSQEKRRFIPATRFFQLIFFSTLGVTLFSLSQRNSNWYDSAVSSQIRDLVYDLDMYPGLECDLKGGFKLAPLGDSRFLIASRDATGYVHFLPPKKCEG